LSALMRMMAQLSSAQIYACRNPFALNLGKHNGIQCSFPFKKEVELNTMENNNCMSVAINSCYRVVGWGGGGVPGGWRLCRRGRMTLTRRPSATIIPYSKSSWRALRRVVLIFSRVLLRSLETSRAPRRIPGSDLIIASATASRKISVPPRRLRRSKFEREVKARFRDERVSVDRI
jgi:hypothetical protein